MLPDLPRQKKSKEADFGITFRKWWNEHPLPGTFELKTTGGKSSLPFNAVDPEQIVFAQAAHSRKGTLARVTVGTVGCSDYIGLVQAPAWIVVQYPGEFHVISIESFLLERDRSPRKSLTIERARAISTISV
jgi:hypothetical protein